MVNAAGALQDGARDDLELIHHRAIAALVLACEAQDVRRIVQISATGANPASPLPFFNTKGRGDAAVAASPLDWTILRPGLVIAPQAYGGTALLRALAAIPAVTPLVMGDRPLQTASIFDVADAVASAIEDPDTVRRSFDLVEDGPHTLAQIVAAFRSWLGLPPAPAIAVPAPLARLASMVADGLGRLGWRSPMRSTAMAAIAGGVTGNPEPWRALTGRSLSALDVTLAAIPATVQERWFARLWLLKPVVFGVLAAFWLVSGFVGFVRLPAAVEVLTARGFGPATAHAAVLAGSVVDVLLGLAVLVRSLARPALSGMIAVTLSYLAAATVFTTDLWLDPLGPLVKTIPAALLALVALAILDER